MAHHKKIKLYVMAVFLGGFFICSFLVFLIFLKPTYQCNGQYITKISNEMRSLSKKIGFSNFQLSYYNATSGQTENCTYGWKKWFYPTAVSVQDTQQYASLSKVLTAILVLKLVDDSKIKLDDSIDKYIYEINQPLDTRWHEVTILDLLTHHSGITKLNHYDPMLVEEPLCPSKLDVLNEMNLRPASRQIFEYSNLGYCLLGVIVEKVEGDTLENIFEKYLFKKAHLNSDIFVSNFNNNKSSTGVYYRAGDFELDFKRKLNPSALLAVGSWEGSANSMVRLLVAHLSFEKYLVEYPDCDLTLIRGCHAVGFYVYQKEILNKKMIWRDGSLPGVTAFIGVFESGEIVVFLANARREQDWKKDNEEIAQNIFRIVNSGM